MTTLMVLMAGLTLGSDGTEWISTETDQRLAIDGYWEGVDRDFVTRGPRTLGVRLEPGRTIWVSIGFENAWDCQWVDEGRGRCQFIYNANVRYGIYKRVQGQLIICYAAPGHSRPIAFFADEGYSLLILKPAITPKK
jgi:hypothetical protein